MKSEVKYLPFRFRVISRISRVILFLLVCSVQAQTPYYHNNQAFVPVEFDLDGTPTEYELYSAATQLTDIVKGEAITIITNGTYGIEKEAIAIGYTNATGETAWNAVKGALQEVQQHQGKIYDNVGWIRGTKSVNGEWGAYLWTLQNRIAFHSSQTNWWKTEDGVPVAITNVFVGSLSNYPPMTDCVDIGPHLDGATNTYPGDDQDDAITNQVDITNVYYQLVIPNILIAPREAVATVGSSNAVRFTVMGSNLPNGVTWAVSPTGLVGGAVLQANNGWYYRDVTPGTVPTNYTIRATSKDNTNFYDEVPLVVLKVESIEVSSPVATNSPQFFEGGKTNFGDPCSATTTGQTLIVYYNATVDADFQVQDFDVTLKANVLPASVTADQFTESWDKVEGPNSGSLNQTDTFEVKYQNPKKGGLYQFVFDLGLSGSSNSGANVLLPLAGADMTSWLDTEMKTVGGWAVANKIAVENANDSAIPGVALVNVFNTWCSISGSFFDYVFDPVDAEQNAPCRRFQPYIGSGGYYGYVTINGVVVHGSKINNMLWALFGRYWGWPELCLKTGAHLNQLARSKKIDGSTSQNAIGFGDDIYALIQGNPSASITNVLTPTALRTLQDPSSLIEEKLWPSPDIADTDYSTFLAPTNNLPTTP